MKVTPLNLPAQYATIRKEVDAAVAKIFQTQYFVLGGEGRALEEEVAAYCGVGHGAGASSGSEALYLGLRALGIGPGDEVLTTSFTFFATAGAIIRTGAKPVFGDIDPVTFNLDPALLPSRPRKAIKAVVPVHLYGQVAGMPELTKWARQHKIKVLEDAAQAIGAAQNGKRAGAWGDAAAFSFFPTKNLGGAGDGGMVVSRRKTIADKVKRLRNHGMHPKYVYREIGVNGRLDEIQAAVLRVKLKHLDKWNERRREIADGYRERFAAMGLDEVLTAPMEVAGSHHVYHQFVVRAKQRNGLKKHLNENGIAAEIYYPLPLHQQPCFADLKIKKGSLPETERASREVLALPIYAELEEAQLDYVCEAIANFYQSGKRRR